MFIQKMDEAISSWMITLHGNHVVNEILKYFTLLGEAGIFWILCLLTVLIVVVAKKKKAPVVLLCGAAALLLGWIFNDFCLKILVQRVRPYHNTEVFGDAFTALMDSINYKYPSSYSFPSGHSFSSFNAATTLTLYNKKFGWFAYPIAIIIAFSRVFLGAHYFTDVLTGMILGICFSLGGYFIGKALLKTKKIGESKYATR